MFYRTFGRELASVALKAVATVVTVVTCVFLISAYYSTPFLGGDTCTIAVYPLEGVILPYNGFAAYDLVVTPKAVREFIALAESDPFIEGILFEVNSPGGTPVAAEHISQSIRSSSLPSVSLIGDVGASGGYLVAAAAQTIIASAMSDVGSIGVTMSYVEESKKNEEEGLTFVPLASGKYKDAGNPNKPLTEEERALFEADLALVHDEFVKQVAQLRDVPVSTIEALADGAAMPGVRALEAGLIDRIGGRDVVRSEFAALLDRPESEITFCDYEPTLFF